MLPRPVMKGENKGVIGKVLTLLKVPPMTASSDQAVEMEEDDALTSQRESHPGKAVKTEPEDVVVKKEEEAPAIILGSSASSKTKVRKCVQRYLKEHKLVSPQELIGSGAPDFQGSSEATERLEYLICYKEATTIWKTRDSSLNHATVKILKDGKTLFTSSRKPRERAMDQLLLGLGDSATVSDAGIFECAGEPCADNKINLVIVGSLAVSREGHCIGKGEGQTDLNWAILMDSGAITRDTTVITLVHDCQVVDFKAELMQPHDLPVDIIVTPTQVIQCPKNEKPPGIDWSILPPWRLRSGIPVRLRTPSRQGMDTEAKHGYALRSGKKRKTEEVKVTVKREIIVEVVTISDSEDDGEGVESRKKTLYFEEVTVNRSQRQQHIEVIEIPDPGEESSPRTQGCKRKAADEVEAEGRVAKQMRGGDDRAMRMCNIKCVLTQAGTVKRLTSTQLSSCRCTVDSNMLKIFVGHVPEHLFWDELNFLLRGRGTWPVNFAYNDGYVFLTFRCVETARRVCGKLSDVISDCLYKRNQITGGKCPVVALRPKLVLVPQPLSVSVAVSLMPAIEANTSRLSIDSPTLDTVCLSTSQSTSSTIAALPSGESLIPKQDRAAWFETKKNLERQRTLMSQS